MQKRKPIENKYYVYIVFNGSRQNKLSWAIKADAEKEKS